MRSLVILLAIFALFRADPSVKWRTDLAQATTEAKAQGKLLLVYHSTPNCHWCRKLESSFQDDGVKRELSRFICVKQNSAPGIKSFPTIVVSKDGTEKARVVGYVDGRGLKAKLEAVK